MSVVYQTPFTVGNLASFVEDRQCLALVAAAPSWLGPPNAAANALLECPADSSRWLACAMHGSPPAPSLNKSDGLPANENRAEAFTQARSKLALVNSSLC
jgi:hypothetical protein